MLGAAAEQLSVAADRRERRAQLVGRVGDEPAQTRFGRAAFGERRFDPFHHDVQRAAEPADLGPSFRRLDAPRQVAGGDIGGGVLHLGERAQSEPHQPERDSRDRGEDGGGHDRLDQEQLVQGVLRVAERERENDGAAIGALHSTFPPGGHRRHSRSSSLGAGRRRH